MEPNIPSPVCRKDGVEIHAAVPKDITEAFSVIAVRENGAWLLVRHSARKTWELPGGHREPDETPLEAACRELYEETGALRFCAPAAAIASHRADRRAGVHCFWRRPSRAALCPKAKSRKYVCLCRTAQRAHLPDDTARTPRLCGEIPARRRAGKRTSLPRARTEGGTPVNDALYLRAVGIAAAVQPDYSFSLPAVRALARMGRLRLEKPVTFLVGENGTGKSTLLEAIAAAWGFNPEGGTRNFRFSTARTHAELYRSLVLQRGPRRPRDGFFLRAESFYNVATEIDRLDEIAPLKGAYGGRSLHEQSHGESFLALVLNRFSGSGLYLLDEPEAALSPARQLALLAALDGLVRKNSQFLIATHSPLLLAYPNAEIFVLSERGIEKTPYRQTEPYLLTKRFLEAPERMLNELLGTEEEAFEAR